MDVRELFLSCVGSADGDFGIPQLRQVLSSVGSDELPEEKLAEMMIQLDVDGDGRVSLEDFTIAMTAFVNGALSGQGAHGQDENVEEESTENGNCENGAQDPDFLSTSSISERNGGFSVEKTRLATRLEAFAAQFYMTPDDLAALWEHIDDYVESVGDAQKEEILAANKRCAQMAQINQSLNEEMQRIEAEYNESVFERKRSQETINENAKLSANLRLLQGDLAKLMENERTLMSRIKVLEGENERLNKKNESHEKEVDRAMDKYRALERERDLMVGDYKATVLERDNLLTDLKRLAQTIKEFEAENAGLKRNVEEAEQENNSLRSIVDELRVSISMKEEALESLRSTLDEQAAHIQSLQSNGSNTNHSGSVLNEIEDIVMSQLREENAETEENKKMTVALLSRLLPKIEETKLTQDPVTTTATIKAMKRNISAPTLSAFRPAAPVAVLESHLGSFDEESSSNISTPGSPDKLHVRRGSCSPDKIIGSPERRSVSPLKEAGSNSPDKYSSRRGCMSRDTNPGRDSTTTDAASARSVSSRRSSESSVSALDQHSGAPASSAETPETPDHSDAFDGKPVPPPINVSETGASRAGGAGGAQPASDADGEEKLNQVLRLYAASTQHLVGMKIITREQAEGMDVHALRQLKRTLEDLKNARSQRLVEALKERDNLRNEILVKKTVVIPILDMWRLHEVGTRSSSPNNTPRIMSAQTPNSSLKKSGSFKNLTPSGSVKRPDSAVHLKRASHTPTSGSGTPLRQSRTSSLSSAAPQSPRTSAFDFTSWFRSSPKTSSQPSSRPTTPPPRGKGEGTELCV